MYKCYSSNYWLEKVKTLKITLYFTSAAWQFSCHYPPSSCHRYVCMWICTRFTGIQSSVPHNINFAPFLLGIICSVEASLVTELQCFIYNSIFKTVTNIRVECGGKYEELIFAPLPPPFSLWITLALVWGRNPGLGQQVYKHYKCFPWRHVSIICQYPQKAEMYDKRESEICPI